MIYDRLLLYYARKGICTSLRKSAFRKYCRRNRGLSDTVMTQDGFKIKTIVGDSVDNVIYVYGIYEEATSSIIKKLSRQCASFVDVGCNIGYYSCLFGTFNRKGSIYGIDPNPKMIDRTRGNLALNQLSNVQLFPIAVGPESCKMTLNIPADRHSLSSLAYVPSRSHGVKNDTLQVDVWPLKSIIEKYNIADALVKIDTEGFEYQVFCGLDERSVSAIKYLIFELSVENLKAAGVAPDSLLSFDWFKQFDSFRIDDETGSIIKEDSLQSLIKRGVSANILLVRKGHTLP